MQKTLLFLILTLSYLGIHAQQTIQGTITDSDGKPVEFVSTGVKGTATGTLSNEQGQFLLQVKTLPATLVISHLSYLPQEVIVNNNQPLVITLKPQVVQLQEVMVGDPALILIKQAADKAYKDALKPHLAKAFSRQIMTEGDQPVFIGENFMDVQWQNWGLTRFNTTNTRYLQRPGAVSYTNVTLLSYISSGFLRNTVLNTPFSHKPDSLYKFTIKETFKNGEQEVIVITCQLKDVDKLTHAAFAGDVYIDAQTYNVLKTEGELYKLKLNSSGAFGIKLKNIKVVAQYKTDADGSNLLDYASYTMYSTVKLLGFGVKNVIYSSKLFVLGYDKNIDPATLKEIDFKSKEKDEDRAKKVAYDPEFWKNNPVIRRTQAEDAAIISLEGQKNKSGTIE